MRSDEFLDLYRKFEDILEDKFINRKKKYSSVIFDYLKCDESKPIRDKIDVCREIRNLLTHNAKMNGESVVEPSQSVCDALRYCIEYVKKPPLAIDFATTGENIYMAGYNQTVIKIMRVMDKNGYSHVPIIQNGKFVGVFSTSTIFSYMLNNYEKSITRTTTVAEMQEHLPIDVHIENYEFAPRTLTLYDARDKFQSVVARNRRLSVIFITEHGKQNEELLGMLTPWDVLGDK